MARRTKNNPVLIGEPGVGKTAVAEGLAQLILNENVPDFLDGSLIMALDLGSILAGTKYRGEFEERLKRIVEEVQNDSAVIIVNPAPTIFTMNPTGSQCPGTILRLNGSDAGLNYYLLLNGIPLDTIAGTGVIGFLDYGPQFDTGTYTIKAVNNTKITTELCMSS